MMNRTPFLTGFLTVLFLLSFVSKAQENIPETGKEVINAEPPHAYYKLGEGCIFPIHFSPVENGFTTYRYSFPLQSSWSMKQLFVRLTGISAPFQLKINGFVYGKGDNVGAPLEFNITPFLRKDFNTLELQFDLQTEQITPLPVHQSELIIREAVHLRDLRISSYPGTDHTSSLVRMHLFVQSYLTGRGTDRTLTVLISDPDGAAVSSQERIIDYPLAFRQEIEFIFDHTLVNPRLWSPGHAELYHLQISLGEDGNGHGDTIFTHFGIRNTLYRDSVLVINQDTVPLLIADLESLGNLRVRPESEILRFFEETGNLGVEATDYIPDKLMDLFDRQGILVFRKEPLSTSFPVRYHHNRPSVIWTE